MRAVSGEHLPDSDGVAIDPRIGFVLTSFGGQETTCLEASWGTLDDDPAASETFSRWSVGSGDPIAVRAEFSGADRSDAAVAALRALLAQLAMFGGDDDEVRRAARTPARQWVDVLHLDGRPVEASVAEAAGSVARAARDGDVLITVAHVGSDHLPEAHLVREAPVLR